MGVHNIRKDLTLDTEGLAAHWGIRPDQVVDYQALVGDTVDAIPGVPLIGPKIAAELLRKHGTLDEILAHAEEMPAESGVRTSFDIASRGSSVANWRDWQTMFRCTSIGSWPELDGLMWSPSQICREFGFRRLAERLGQLQIIVPANEDGWTSQYHVVNTSESLKELEQQLAEQRASRLV